MSHPQTCPGNVNKHPGNIVWEANRVQCRSKEEVAAEKNRKEFEKANHAAAVEKSRTMIAAAEDAMAIQQKTQVKGPPKLVRPRMVVNKKSADMTKAVEQPAVTGEFQLFHTNLKQVISSDLAGPIPDWAEKVASQTQLKPSTPPSVRRTARPTESAVDLDDKPEEYSEPAPKAQRGKNIVHLNEKPKFTSRGIKCSLPVPDEIELSAEELKDLDTAEEIEIMQDPDTAEELEILEDPEADEELENLDDLDAAEDFKMLEDGEAEYEDDKSNSAMVMSVDVSEQKPATKQAKGRTTKIKAEVKTEPEAVVSENIRAKLKKGKARNAHLPSGVLENRIWCMKFLPCVMYWVEAEFESVLEVIFYAVYPCTKGPCDFNVEELAFQLVSQRVHEWRASFGSTAVTVLMAFFTSTLEYETQEAREEYTEYQLQECRFIYEDPDNEEQPGVFLSEYILCIFAAHLTAVAGKVRVDSLVEFGKPGYQTALALTAVAAERALVLVKDRLLIVSDPTDNGGKSHKIVQTLNEVTNKMSHTGTAFSSGNWETDTMAYMDSIKALPYEHIQETLEQSENYMKHPHFNHCSSVDDGSTTPVNKRSRLHISGGRIIFLNTTMISSFPLVSCSFTQWLPFSEPALLFGHYNHLP
ncbi:hypothetical protein C8R48DRAFT_772013 [Suillus tomentosus]|nr:hypothetical protein C8R48DRAFT_772013 [Suillus tomentosus]